LPNVRGVPLSLLLLGSLLGPALVLTPASSARPGPAGEVVRTAAPPTHAVSVSGAGVGVYPAFDPAITRYAVTTTEATAGSLTVTATTSDPTGKVYVDGRLAPDGSRTLTGLEEGDEVSVFIDDSAGVARHSFVYLPAEFPALARVDAPGVTDADLNPGLVLLTLGLWLTPSPFFETAVDANGVPAMVHTTTRSLDLKRQPNGSFSVSRTTTTPDRTGTALVELDDRFREVARYETQGLVDTDGHDSILLPDGSRYLLAYEPDPATGLTDAVIQEVGPDGSVVFEWNSADHVDPATESVSTSPDNAHVNSIAIMANGDLLVSFRHLSSVFEVARTAHDGFAVGDVVWKLGGRDSTLSFVGDPDGGPCAQHAASELADGHILLFDNGSATLTNAYCVDPADRTGPTIERPITRIKEYAVDAAAGTATLVWSWQKDDRFAHFAGSAQRLANGDTLVGWAAETDAIVSEVAPDGELLWELRDPEHPAYFTYRAAKTEVPDTTPPAVDVQSPVGGATYVRGQRVVASFDCSDRGGSSLSSCAAPTEAGAAIDTDRVGTHTFRVLATDGAGNVSTRTRTYTVRPAHRLDGLIRLAGTAGFTGGDVYGGSGKQQVTARIGRHGRAAAVVRFENDGTERERYRLAAPSGSDRFRVEYTFPSTASPVTSLDPGESTSLRVIVTRRGAARPGDRITIEIAARSTRHPAADDAVSFRVVARPRLPGAAAPPSWAAPRSAKPGRGRARGPAHWLA
jgi:hypothetical protein